MCKPYRKFSDILRDLFVDPIQTIGWVFIIGGASLGGIGGLVSGFLEAGIGGAIAYCVGGVLFGAIGGFALYFLVAELICFFPWLISLAMLLALLGLIVWIIQKLWGVGKP